MKLKPSKCEVFKTSLNYLGHVVLKDGRGADPKKMKAIVNCPVPVTGTGIRTFLGLPNYYKRLTSKYVNIARPLNVLIAGKNALRKNIKVE